MQIKIARGEANIITGIFKMKPLTLEDLTPEQHPDETASLSKAHRQSCEFE